MKLTSKLRLTTAVALCALALSNAGVFAAGASPAHSERGLIKSVDADAHTLVVTDRSESKEHKFLWNDQTKFTGRGKTVTAADLKAGEHVRISYSGSGDPPIMQRVLITPARVEKSTPDKS